MISKTEKQPHGSWLLKSGNIPCDLQKLPKCNAKAKSTRNRCRKPAMKNKRVCYLHGGRSPGAPKGNGNAFRHGFYTAKAIAKRRRMRKLIKNAEKLVRRMKEASA